MRANVAVMSRSWATRGLVSCCPRRRHQLHRPVTLTSTNGNGDRPSGPRSHRGFGLNLRVANMPTSKVGPA
ncbi:MAG: hypothetical protein RL701_6957 [Pseudomonadota bacterium]|jgi:hypothetical protein